MKPKITNGVKGEQLSQILKRIDSNEKEEIQVLFNADLRYIAVNKVACKHLEKEAEALLGKSILDLYPEITASSYHRNLLKALYGETIERDRTQNNNGDYFSSTYKPIWEADEIVAVLVTATKITTH